MLHEHALRRVEFFLRQYCREKDIKPIIDNTIVAANRGYSMGTYMVRGDHVVAPVEDPEMLSKVLGTHYVWGFANSDQARNFLVLMQRYMDLRGARVEVLGVEGHSMK